MIYEVAIANLEAIKKVYLKLKPGKILDVGGGDQPIKMATHVVDIQSYEERGRTCKAMGRVDEEEQFTKETWIQLNICDYPWPFKDNEFDFVWCSQTLEDIRDPIGVCREMMRVGKAGYINCPAKVSELIRGVKAGEEKASWEIRNPTTSTVKKKDIAKPSVADHNGFWHHRWLVSLEGNKLIFEQKNAYACIMNFTTDKLKQILLQHPDLGRIELGWEGGFEVEEKFELDAATAVKSLKDYMVNLNNKFKPVPYAKQEAKYMGRTYYVNESVLIPRSTISFYIKDRFKNLNINPKNILDLCTGSGCIGIETGLEFPEASVTVSDISKEAIDVANKNILLHKATNVKAIMSNLFENIPGRFDLILSNPPYITDSDMDSWSEWGCIDEPEIALRGGKEGFDVIDKMLADITNHLTPDGMLVLETTHTMKQLTERYPKFDFNQPIKEAQFIYVVEEK